MHTADIHQLTSEERLDLIEQLWESLCENAEAVKLTEAQRRELDHRLDDLEHSGGVGIPWDDVVRQIRTRAR